MIRSTIALRYLIRFSFVIIATAMATYGLLEWREQRFSVSGFWPFDGERQLHPLHILIAGIVMLPPAFWEIFLLNDARAEAARASHGQFKGTNGEGDERS